MMTKQQILNISRMIFVIPVFLSLEIAGQDTDKQNEKSTKLLFPDIDKSNMFKPVFATEVWITYSMNEMKGETVYADRADVSFRRFRFGGCSSPYSWLKYDFQLHLDRLGEDQYASTKGSYSGIDIWNAYITAKLLKNSDLLNVHAGYFWAAISREFNTSAWSQGSFDRTRANWYMRNFITGKGNGIESGIGLGGLKNYNNTGFGYRVGTFEPQAYANNQHAGRLYTGHFLFSVGDPEQSAYKYRLPGNQWRKRTGVTLGFGVSTQSNGVVINSSKEYADSVSSEIVSVTSKTSFNQSYAYGADILLNYKGLRIDGEYFVFSRTSEGLDGYHGVQWHIRTGYTFLFGGTFVEPVITYDSYNGKGNKNLYKYIGTDYTIDLGINWYLNKDKLKLALHYIIQNGSVSPNTGDYIGCAFQFRI